MSAAPDDQEESAQVTLADRRRDAVHRAIIVLVCCAGALTFLGLIMVYSATAPGAYRNSYLGVSNPFRGAQMQTVYAVIGILLAAGCTFVPVNAFKAFWRWIVAGGFGLQALVFTPLGVTVAGNRNWIAVGPIRLQPSEFLKLALIVGLAVTISQITRRPTQDWREIWGTWKTPAILAGVALILVFLGFDLGTAGIIAVIAFVMMYLGGLPSKVIGYGVPIILVLAAFAISISRSRVTRIKEFATGLFSMPSTTNPTQSDYSLWAFGSGGLGGSGLGTGVEKWPGNLAEAQTDFIFAVVGEELGFFGCLTVIVLFVGIGWALITISRNHPSPYARLLTAGIAVWLSGQAVFNMLVVTGLLPVFGVPLPFLSQGGSSVIACLLAVGVALSAALSVPGVRESFQRSSRAASRVRSVVKEAS